MLNLSSLKSAIEMNLITAFKWLCFLLLLQFSAVAQDGKPESNRFTKVVLAQKLEEPMQFQVMENGKVLYAERKGKLKLYDPATQKHGDHRRPAGEQGICKKEVGKGRR